MDSKLKELSKKIEGELLYSKKIQVLYATDASVYQEMPIAVCFPKTTIDIKLLIAFAKEHKLSLIPRAAGTSLAGQCVGNGIVVDSSKHLNKIIEINAKEGWVKLEPGVIRDELNDYLKDYGLFFGPNTSTSNRCMIGGMVGNNSCGSTSIVYGSTRDYVEELEVIMSDGSEVIFGPLSPKEFKQKRNGDTLESKIYQQIYHALSHPNIQNNIRKHYPKPEVQRRNTGYAIDALLDSNIFTERGENFNFCKLLSGSEGTLAFTTSIKLKLSPLPPKETALLCAHFNSINESLRAVNIVMPHQPTACELMDASILNLAKQNRQQAQNSYFIHGSPAAILMIEVKSNTSAENDIKIAAITKDLQRQNMGYAFPILYPPNIEKAWSLRKAGLGVLANIPGEDKAVACIEDTAVTIEDQPAYIAEFTEMMKGYNQDAIYYAHAGAGEIHLRPILNLRDKNDIQLFHDITESTAKLVKKYGGSLSGEHGDGRVRAPFIPLVLGKENYQLIRAIKYRWDPDNIFNPGKIVDPKPMTEQLRYKPLSENQQWDTYFDYAPIGGFISTLEKCNGSGDCRKSASAAGGMCPSYHATKDEAASTRGRANILRTFITEAPPLNAFAQKELMEILDLCLSCKACAYECPSNVDMAMLKAEVSAQYYKEHLTPLRTRMFANAEAINKMTALLPRTNNFIANKTFLGKWIKNVFGISPNRTIPIASRKNWQKSYSPKNKEATKGEVILLCDEFTNHLDVETGIKAGLLLEKLGYQVIFSKSLDSGRASISKGKLEQVKVLANKNVSYFSQLSGFEIPIIGVEPSAILTFRDEYPKILRGEQQKKAKTLSKKCFTIEEFLANAFDNRAITADAFHNESKQLLVHVHCHQKALSDPAHTAKVLSMPKNYHVEMIPSGCCGMAGSFGYEKEHYEISMKIGELILFPSIRKKQKEQLVVAAGTSCRHQIKDGTNERAFHPVEILWAALVK